MNTGSEFHGETIVCTKALVIAPRHRAPEEIEASYRLPVTIRSVSIAEAPIASRFGDGSHPHSRGLVRAFRGHLWTPMVAHLDNGLRRPVSPVEVSLLKLLLAGQAHDPRNDFNVPCDEKVPDWSQYKQVLDDGMGQAQVLLAGRLERLLLVDDVLYQQTPMIRHRLSVGESGAGWQLRRGLESGQRTRSRDLSLDFSLTRPEAAKRVEEQLAQLLGLAGHVVKADRWDFEVILPDSFLMDPGEQLVLDAVGMIGAVGEDPSIFDLPQLLLDRWIDVRRTAEAVERSVASSCGTLIEPLLTFAAGLGREREFPERDTLSAKVGFAAGMIAIASDAHGFSAGLATELSRFNPGLARSSAA